MRTSTTKDGMESFCENCGSGQPIVLDYVAKQNKRYASKAKVIRAVATRLSDGGGFGVAGNMRIEERYRAGGAREIRAQQKICPYSRPRA